MVTMSLPNKKLYSDVNDVSLLRFSIALRNSSEAQMFRAHIFPQNGSLSVDEDHSSSVPLQTNFIYKLPRLKKEIQALVASPGLLFTQLSHSYQAST